ncbi:hypothetical protein OA07_10255 [Aphanizomenon flos-aquae 2012/KM1/D3]|nr:hypothetical protein OA07_10255 [Aphanizomenon flos-aquae 2012/KM1/D3]
MISINPSPIFFRDFQLKKIPKKFLVVRASCPLITKDRQDAHPTKLGNLFFGDPLAVDIAYSEKNVITC